MREEGRGKKDRRRKGVVITENGRGEKRRMERGKGRAGEER